MGIHNLAPVFSALQLGPPDTVQASSTPLLEETVPVAALVHYQFPARGQMPPVKVHWYDGGLLPERPAELEENRLLDPEDGILFVGEKGKMLVTGWGGENPRLLPESLGQRIPASSQNTAPLHRPLSGMACCLQGRARPALQFRFCRAPDRGRPPGQPLHPQRRG